MVGVLIVFMAGTALSSSRMYWGPLELVARVLSALVSRRGARQCVRIMVMLTKFCITQDVRCCLWP